ncbi:MAG: translation initiation factor IF-2 [Candidatus Zixiibacteriota bacterium]|nr:MAG: translation initiation factor IF-2 [candidate division Zixibacteria bacterium]
MVVKTRRIYEVARDFRVSSQALVKILKELGFEPKSHMSVATPEMIYAANKKFAEEKKAARQEMEQKKAARAKKQVRERPSPAPDATIAGVSGMRVTGGGNMVTGVMRKLERKKKKKERKRKKDRRPIDGQEVSRSFKATMADLSAGKTKKKYRRATAEEGEDGAGEARTIKVNEFMSVNELANLMDLKAVDVIAKLLELGMMATINQRLDMDTIEMVAAEFGFDTETITEIGESAREEEDSEHLQTRAPVVTVMGHVDHGKTSLLDYIRKTNVVAGEAGAITQHVGAYEVSHGDKRIVFVDTPGHEAFTAMRARGSQITDIVVVVVAADEGVKPQTVEAIDHSRAAGVPIIVGLSKIDKSEANPDEVRAQLAAHNLNPEDWGGKTITVEFSAKTGEGVDKLLDMIVLQAELMDLRADPSIRGRGVVVDAHLEKGRGPVATVLIQKGTCSIGDPIVAGTFSGRIRTVTNDRMERIEKVGPATPAQITGLSGVPQAGDTFMAVRSDHEAKEITIKRGQIKREYEYRRAHGPVSLEKIFDQIQEGQIKEVRLIIKGDVDGSVEVLSDTLGKIATSEVKTNIIRRGVGAITESDVMLAAASEAIIIGFQVSPDMRARETARQENVDIRRYNVIYEAESDVKKALEGLLSPEISEKFVGLAEVREIFKVPKIGIVAGTYVREGRIGRKDKVRLVRDGKEIYTGHIASLKRFKEDAREVKEGFECGIGIENFNDIKVGDVIEAIELVETARTLN